MFTASLLRRKNKKKKGLSWWSSGKEFAFQCRGHGSIPSQGIKTPHATEQLSPSTTAREARMPQLVMPVRRKEDPARPEKGKR